MRTLIEYIRSCLCKHDWELLFNTDIVDGDKLFNSIKVYRCKKCGLEKRYKARQESEYVRYQ